MATFYSILTASLAFVCLINVVTSLEPPQNVTKSLLNLNFEVYWKAPQDVNNITRYTVEYGEHGRWYAIPQCTHIRRTECLNMTRSLIDRFDQQRVLEAVQTGFSARINRHDGVFDHGSGVASIVARFLPYTGATIGAPSILSLESTSHALSVGLLAPDTPFRDVTSGQPIRMDDKNLPGVSKVYYNYTLWETPRGSTIDAALWTMEELMEHLVARRGVHGYTTVRLKDLKPNTDYVLAVQARIGLKMYSKDRATLRWKSPEAAPSQRPVLQPLVVMKTDCRNPDSRVVQVKWKPPPMKNWNGDSLTYEVRATSGSGHVTVFTTVSTSTTIYRLGRWDHYDVVVFANTSAGGTASFQVPLPATVVGMANSKPEDIKILTESRNSTQVIAWKPPSNYPECIVGYHVTLRPDSTSDRPAMEQSLANGTAVGFENLAPGTYLVEVAAVVRSGVGHTAPGVAGHVRLVVRSRLSKIVTPAVISVVVIVLAVVAVFRFRHLCKDDKFKGLEDNIILKRATSHDYCQLRRKVSEKEVYDTLNGDDPLTRQTSSMSRDSETSNQTACSSGYVTDAASGAVDDEVYSLASDTFDVGMSDKDGGHSPLLTIDPFNIMGDLSDDDSVFDVNVRLTSGMETSPWGCASPNQSTSRDIRAVCSFQGDCSSAPGSYYTPCPSSTYASDYDEFTFCKKETRNSSDSLSKPYSGDLSLKYTVLADLNYIPTQSLAYPQSPTYKETTKLSPKAPRKSSTSDLFDQKLFSKRGPADSGLNSEIQIQIISS